MQRLETYGDLTQRQNRVLVMLKYGAEDGPAVGCDASCIRRQAECTPASAQNGHQRKGARHQCQVTWQTLWLGDQECLQCQDGSRWT